MAARPGISWRMGCGRRVSRVAGRRVVPGLQVDTGSNSVRSGAAFRPFLTRRRRRNTDPVDQPFQTIAADFNTRGAARRSRTGHAAPPGPAAREIPMRTYLSGSAGSPRPVSSGRLGLARRPPGRPDGQTTEAARARRDPRVSPVFDGRRIPSAGADQPAGRRCPPAAPRTRPRHRFRKPVEL